MPASCLSVCLSCVWVCQLRKLIDAFDKNGDGVVSMQVGRQADRGP